MKRIVKLVIDVDDENEFICGECFSKKANRWCSGPLDYRCTMFNVNLSYDSGLPVMGKSAQCERCSDCLLLTSTRKDYMA